MSGMELYRKRVGNNGISGSKTRLIYEARKNFERSLKFDPSAMKVKITGVGEVNISEDTKLVNCIINDISNNDQKAYDEKVLYVRYDENVGVGSYVEFDNFIWLVIFKEHRAANAYKRFTIRKCNQIIKYKYKNEIYSIPAIVKNLTQYSDGLQDIVYTSTPDSRRSITYSNNPITSNIELGHRFVINNKRTYRVTHIQDFEYKDSYELDNGIATCIAIHTASSDKDDTENNLAYNEATDTNDDDIVMIGSKATYKVDIDECTWEVEYTSTREGYVITYPNGRVCTVDLEFDFDLNGEKFTLKALDLEGNIILKKDIAVVGYI